MHDVNRRPTAITYKSFLAVLWTPTALGLVPLPGSLANTPGIYGQTAAVAVVVGCVTSLIGLLWWGQRLTGLTIEQVGLVSIGGGCTLYLVALMGVPQPLVALPAMAFAAAFSAGAVVQFIMIWKFRTRQVVTP
jgi:hypothetical protein